jgi:ERF superfamily
MEDILKEITPLLGRHGLVIFQSETGRAMFDNDNVIAVEYAFSVVHASGEAWPHQLRQTGVSRCRDSKGGWDDKALNKCHTAARKYFLLSLFQIPTGDEEDADRGDNDRGTPRKTLAKKDARDIYTKLQAELDANATRRELNEWGEANVERIRLLPSDWQDTLRLRYQEHLIDLQNRELKHDADGVVWEEDGERPATQADNDDGLDIPAVLDRRPKREPTLKERLLAAVPDLGSVRDCLHYSLEMSKFDGELSKHDRDEIAGALRARQKILALNGGTHAQ